MYIALNAPAVPEYKAVVKLKPVTKQEPMRIKNRYQSNFWDSKIVSFVVLVWLVAAIITGLINSI